MPEIIVDISCDEETCGDCQCKDSDRNYCEVFLDFIEDDMRIGECLEAQDYAEQLDFND